MASRKLQRRSSTLEEESVNKLYHHFIRIDKDGNGVLDPKEVLSVPSVAENPLASRLIEVMDMNRSASVDFNEFVRSASIFSKDTETSRKIRFAFDVYDLDNDGYISNGELFLVLKVMSGDHLKPLELQQVVDKTIRDCDTDGDGKISFDEFRSMVERKNADFFALWNFNDL